MKKALFILTTFGAILMSADTHFSVFESKAEVAGGKLLIIGGIHGDEPGGYIAATLFAKHYNVKSGSVITVPNLNYDSIIENKRGIYGDMNRKFKAIAPNDKDSKIVSDIKDLIIKSQPDLVLNLHDGHGYYRPKRISSMLNPSAWGQAAIIDQEILPGARYGNLSALAKGAMSRANIALVEDVHEFNVKNTQTANKDKDMQLSLTWFAVSNNIPALAIETSKNISETHIKAFYHLSALEHFMAVLGIEFERDFELTISGIKEVMPEQNRLRDWLRISLEQIEQNKRIAHQSKQ